MRTRKGAEGLVALLLSLGLGLVLAAQFASGEPTEEADPAAWQYLGQEPPDTTPVLFPPAGLRANGEWFWHSPPMFSPDLTEMFFARYVGAQPQPHIEIQFVKYENGEWTPPQKPSFAGEGHGEMNPVFHRSNDLLYFVRHEEGAGSLYKTERAAGSWSQPVAVPVTVPGGYGLGLQFSLTGNGTLYAELCDPNDTDGNIKCWPLVNGVYQKSKKLKGKVNSTSYELLGFVDPEERFLLFSSNRPGGFGGFDLYVTFRGANGKWSAPRNLGASINTSVHETWPCISPDGKYFFFCREGEFGFDPYWADAAVLAQP